MRLLRDSIPGIFHRARLMRGWTPEELAAHAGTWPSTIDRLEAGRHLDTKVLIGVAGALGVEAIELAMLEQVHSWES